jgi:hypothetical protein
MRIPERGVAMSEQTAQVFGLIQVAAVFWIIGYILGRWIEPWWNRNEPPGKDRLRPRLQDRA